MTTITLSELELICRAAGKNIDYVIAPVIKQTAYKIAKTQRQTVPVKTGRTKKSIRATGPRGQWFRANTVEAEIGPKWWVGRLIESGTVRMAPRPFVAPSYEPHRADHEKRILEAVFNESLKGLTQ